MTKKDTNREEEPSLFPFPTIPLTGPNLADKAYKRTTQMNKSLSLRETKRNLVIVGWGLLFIFCNVATFAWMPESVSIVSRIATGFVLFGIVLFVTSILMYLRLKLRK